MNDEQYKVRQKLGDILHNHGLLSKEQLEVAIKYQKKNYQKLGRILVKLGFITDSELSETLAKQLSIPIVDLDKIEIKEEAYSLLKSDFVRTTTALPLYLEGGELVVAFADPLDFDTYQSIVFKTGHKVKRVIADREQIKEKISKLYDVEFKDNSFELSIKDLQMGQGVETPSTKAALDIIWHINGILKKIHQYPIESQAVKNALKWAYDNIRQFLKKFGNFHLYMSENGTFVNNEILPSKDFVEAFTDFLDKVYINSFSIDDGLTFDEFKNMISILNHCFSKPSEYSQLSRLFKEMGIINAKLGEITYSQDTAILHTDESLISDYIDGKISLIPVLGKLTTMIIDSQDVILNILKQKKASLREQNLKAEEEKETYTKMIYRILRILTIEDNPDDTAKLLDKIVYIFSNLDAYDLLDALISEHSSSEQKNVLENIITNNATMGNYKYIYQAAKNAVLQDSFYNLRINQINTILSRLNQIQGFGIEIKDQKREIEIFYKKEDVLQLSPEEKNMTLLGKAIEIGNTQEADRVFDLMFCDNQEIMKKYGDKKPDVLSLIILKMIDEGYSESVDKKLEQLFVRLKQAVDVYTITELLEVYKKIFIPLVKSIHFSSLLSVSSYLIDFYKSTKSQEDKKYFQISIKNFFAAISNKQNIDELINSFKTQNEQGKKDTTELIRILDEFTIAPILKKLKTSTNKEERMTLIEILVRAEDKSMGPLLEELIMKNPWFVVRNAVHILGRIGNPMAVGFLKQALKHEDHRVKNEAFRAVWQLKGKNVEDLIGELLDSQNFDTQCRAIKLLGRIKCEKYKGKLRNILQRRRGDIQEEFSPLYSYVCHALGRIKDEESIGLLSDIVKTKLFSKQSTYSKLRASACWALGKIGGKQVHKILDKLKSDNDIIVRKTADHALRHQMESEDSQN